MKTSDIIIIIIILIVIIFLFNKRKDAENYGSLIQLYSRGPQDDYLTVNNYPFYDSYYFRNPFFWNMPTRFNRNSAPYLLLTPERYLLY